jgi:hypothetical protein
VCVWICDDVGRERVGRFALCRCTLMLDTIDRSWIIAVGVECWSWMLSIERKTCSVNRCRTLSERGLLAKACLPDYQDIVVDKGVWGERMGR